MGWREDTEFEPYGHFDKMIEDCSAAMEIVADIIRFQNAYKQSDTNNDLPRSFNFKELEKAAGKYTVYEIYVGPKNSFRAIIMFPHKRLQERLLAYWVFLFKKQRQNDRPMVNRAKALARECWNSIEGA